MNIPIETINAAMSLTGGVLTLLATIIAAVVTMLPSERKAAAATQIRVKALSFLNIASAMAAFAFLVFFDMPRISLLLMLIYTALVSINFLRAKNPVSRSEILLLIIQFIIVASLLFMFMFSRVIAVMEKIVS